MVCGNRKGQMFVWNANAGAGYVRGGDGADGGVCGTCVFYFPNPGTHCFISQLVTVVHTSRYTRTRRDYYYIHHK